MSTQVGIVKQVSGNIVAIDAHEKQRALAAGDAIFLVRS